MMPIFRSYHGPDNVKALQFYYPDTPLADIERVLAELEARDWSKFDGNERDYQRAVFITKELGHSPWTR